MNVNVVLIEKLGAQGDGMAVLSEPVGDQGHRGAGTWRRSLCCSNLLSASCIWSQDPQSSSMTCTIFFI